MKTVVLLLASIVSLCFRPGLAADLSALSWLEGRWKGSFEGMDYEEFYSSARGGTILWMSKLYRDGEVIFFEFGTIEQKDDEIFYVPYPNGSKGGRFRLVEMEAGEKIVFENNENTFPTRFRFERSDGELEITLTGPPGTEDRTQKVELKKVQ